ncbi:tannase/feruloyl esterase family alpha/beta hydrolase [Novosphingobium flavum]|uniref:Tannase/feruloyl esterase family alpha/beta hydrolase n=1 Tax=Novosphingobium flavum TaxID=1778672 RepID=A0A7X1KMP5_9SPHN|nr:tannase/feruloyl esterase family alpha/beta hydrolase [Novosphingobium flavum]MBC2666837.1 tannase/feruloyl esterase family alpha/beta hydrolase [Novosphingobium flavum]
MLRRVFPALAAILLASLGMAPTAGAAGLPDLPAVSPVTSCASLAGLDLAGATGAKTTLAASEVAGSSPYCKVTGTIAPAIRFEVRLPLAGWTQRYLQTGCGGLCGNLRIDAGKAEGCTPVTDGRIVLASTDMGHQGNATEWGEDKQKREDFAFRGVHATALAAKALIRAFYGQPQRYAYFSGCSDGGREALMEAQRFPEDFDGIAAGAPALNFTVQNSFHHGWLARVNTDANGKAILLADDARALYKLALATCDKLDGLADGQIDDPRRCRVNPALLLCKGAYEAGKCLTADKVEAARLVYQGARSAKGTALEVGPLQPGSEEQWIGVFVPTTPDGRIGSAMFAGDTINHLLFTPNPATPYTPKTFPFTEAMYRSEEPARALYSADNADLSGFARRGGKLILWHGWSDPHISPLNTIDYFERAGLKMGKARRDAMTRMFLFPGMGHCSGGDGPSEFPLLANLMAWVEGGTAPSVMQAHRAGQTAEGLPVGISGGAQSGQQAGPPAGMGPPRKVLPPRSRPVYAYPAVARYSGTGSTDTAASFKAVTPAPVNGVAKWIGAGR